MRKIVFSMFLSLLIANVSFAKQSEEAQCSFNGIDYKQAQTFVHDLKDALKNNDKNKVADLVSYPLRINTTKDKKIISYKIKTKQEFLSQYDSIFTSANIKSVMNDNEIFCNYQGAMLAGGFIWFDGKKIFAINK